MDWIDKVKGSGYYDCIIGLSGGVDSSYLAHLAVNVWKLKPLAFTFDNEWNDPIALDNIKAMIKKLKIDHVSYRKNLDDLNRAMIMSGLTDVDIPSDLALLRTTFDKMYEFNIKYYLSGANPHTEIPIPLDWSLLDDSLMMDVYGKETDVPRLTAEFYLQHVQDHIEIRPFHFMELPDDEVIKGFLEKEYGWKRYGGKHCENIYTRWTIYSHLPVMFNIHKWEYYKGYNKVSISDRTEDILERLGISEDAYFKLVTGDRSFREKYKNNLGFWRKHKQELKGKVPESFWNKYV